VKLNILKLKPGLRLARKWIRSILQLPRHTQGSYYWQSS